VRERNAQEPEVQQEERDKQAHPGIGPAPDNQRANQQEGQRGQQVQEDHVERVGIQGKTCMQERGQRLRVQLISDLATGDRTWADGKERVIVCRKAHDECSQVNQHEHKPECL